MAQTKEDNTVFVLQKAIRKFKIKISNTSIREFLLSHPHYPSLKSVCDFNASRYTYTSKGSDVAQNFLSQWYSLSKVSRKALYSDQPLPEGFNLAQQIGEQNGKLFENAKITGTPTIFVNSYKFPIQYQYSDLFYYIDDLKN